MDAGRGSYLCGLVLGMAIGIAGTHVALSSRSPRPATPPLLTLEAPASTRLTSDSGSSLKIELPAITPLPPQELTSSIPQLPAVHALATEASSPDSEESNTEAPRTLPEIPGAAPLQQTGSAVAVAWTDNQELREFIKKELGPQPDQQIEIWVETLQGLPISEAREILKIWQASQAGDSTTGQPARFPIPQSLKLNLPKTVHAPAGDMPAPDHSTPNSLEPVPSRELPHGTAQSELEIRQYNLTHSLTPGFRAWQPMQFDSSSPMPPAEAAHAPFVFLDLSQGLHIETGRRLDLAIDGDGFFQVSSEGKTLASRCGRLVLNDDRKLCLPQPGGQLLPLIPEVVLPENATRIEISEKGDVSVVIAGQAEQTVVGQIALVSCLDPSRLRPFGRNLYEATASSGPLHVLDQEHRPALIQNHYEASNVDVGHEHEAIEFIQAHH